MEKIKYLILFIFLISCKTIEIKQEFKFSHKIDFFELLKFAIMSNLAYKSDEEILNYYSDYDVYIGYAHSSNIKYFILTSKKNVTQYISIQGTKNFKNIILDMELLKRNDSKIGIYLHRGFEKAAYEVFKDIIQKNVIKKNCNIMFTGHSLGGAISVILAMYLKEEGYTIKKIITFGQPKITNLEGVNKCNDLPILRIVNLNDEITYLPPNDKIKINPKANYMHFGPEVILLKDSYYIFLESPNSEEKDVSSFWANIEDERFKDHRIWNYIIDIIPKLHKNIEVPFSQKENYIENLDSYNDKSSK